MITFTSATNRVAALIAGSALFLPTTGCGRGEIRVYDVPKARPAAPIQMAQSQMGAMPAHAGMTGRPTLTWKTPAGWTEAPGNEMRVGSFTIHGGGKQADVSIVPLGGAAGGDVANVNRWRGQIGLGELSAEDLRKTAEKVEIAGQPADLYDIAGVNAASGDRTRIIGAIQHRGGTAWFFKMTGEDGLVAGQKKIFVEFLKSVSFGAPGTGAHAHSHPPTDAGTLPDGHPPIGGSALPDGHPPIGGSGLPAGHPEISSAGTTPTTPAPAPALSPDGKPAWQPPAGWQEVPGGQFLVAKFLIGTDPATQTTVNVSMSPGDAGGFVSNINRWRSQIGLSPLPDAEVNKLGRSVDVLGGRALFVDLSGTDPRTGQPARVVGAMVPRSRETWFYKLAGESRLVEAQKEAFEKFVQSVKY